MREMTLLVSAMLVLMLAGCGQGLKRVPIQGKLTAKGKPVDNAAIQFLPVGSTPGDGAGGITDSDGNFTVVGGRDVARGLPPGEYKVRVSRMATPDGAGVDPNLKEVDYPRGAFQSIPQKYFDPLSTPLTVTIGDVGGPVNIDIPERLTQPRVGPKGGLIR